MTKKVVIDIDNVAYTPWGQPVQLFNTKTKEITTGVIKSKKGEFMKTKKAIKEIKMYVISSTLCNSLNEALDQIRAWDCIKSLNKNTRVFEITTKTKVFEPSLELKEIK